MIRCSGAVTVRSRDGSKRSAVAPSPQQRLGGSSAGKNHTNGRKNTCRRFRERNRVGKKQGGGCSCTEPGRCLAGRQSGPRHPSGTRGAATIQRANSDDTNDGERRVQPDRTGRPIRPEEITLRKLTVGGASAYLQVSATTFTDSTCTIGGRSTFGLAAAPSSAGGARLLHRPRHFHLLVDVGRQLGLR